MAEIGNFSQIVFSNHFEGVLYALTKPLSVLEKTCIVHHPTNPLMRFEGKVFNSLSLKILEMGYYSHGIKRLHKIDSYLKPLRIYWGHETTILLGQKSPYQNLMELCRANYYAPGLLEDDEIRKISSDSFNYEFEQIIRELARVLYFEGLAAGEQHFKSMLKQRTSIFPILRKFNVWFRKLDRNPMIFSELFLFSAFDTKLLNKNTGKFLCLDILKFLMPYYYLESELLTRDLLKDAQDLGSVIHQTNKIEWSLQGSKILNAQLANSSYKIAAKKYVDATIQIHAKNMEGKVLPKNIIGVKYYKFKLNELLDHPIFGCLPNYHHAQSPWSIGPTVFAYGSELHLYFPFDSNSEFWSKDSWHTKDYLILDHLRDWFAPFLKLSPNMKPYESGPAILGSQKVSELAGLGENQLADDFCSSLLEKKLKGYESIFKAFDLRERLIQINLH
jgi:hypothetical protein